MPRQTRIVQFSRNATAVRSQVTAALGAKSFADVAIVVAVKRLVKDGDQVAAGKLLSDYVRRHPGAWARLKDLLDL